MSRYDSGAAPVMIRCCRTGDRSRRRPVLQPLRARVVTLPLFDPPRVASTATGWPRVCARWPRRISGSGPVPGSTKAGSDQIYYARALPDARPVLAEAFRSRVPGRIRRDISHRLRRFLVLPVSVAGILAEAVRLRAGRLAVRAQSAGGSDRRGVSEARALRTAGRDGERIVS